MRSPAKKRISKLKNIFLTILVLWLCIISFLVCWENGQTVEISKTNNIKGQAEITDGDSIRIHGKRIRLIGIDAPEIQQFCTREDQKIACGKKAKAHLRYLIANQTVRCEWTKKDFYSRILGLCFAGEVNLNRTMVADGWAVSYDSYSTDECEARRYRQGMWKWNFIHPYEWRKAKKRATLMEE